MKIGFKLQEVLIKKAEDLQTEAIWLSVLESNNKAISFYKKSDFKIVGQHGFRIGKEHFDFVVMSKALKSAGDGYAR